MEYGHVNAKSHTQDFMVILGISPFTGLAEKTHTALTQGVLIPQPFRGAGQVADAQLILKL